MNSFYQEIPNPWFTMWRHPRETVRMYLQAGSGKWLWILAILAGIKLFLDNADAQNVGDQIAFGNIILLSLVFGPLVGIFYWYLFSGLFTLTGQILGLPGRWSDMRRAVGLSFVPLASLMPFWVIKLVLFGSEVFTPWTPVLDSSLWLLLLIVLFYLVDLVIGGWYLVTLSRSVAEVYECSAWLAFALILLSSVVFSVVLSFVLLFFV
ncbi:Yip1-like protein [Planifilum fimeticola]|uniref:Yip1-like protein n=1 Tax=Planifilum fimeticola TaxID=201975 RepID=A0A2T0LAN3_9BACL|nr:YIP1 family protein [Planifilum fimeticola]PRX38887.1 Yip1-like protein [Planifilum fimeticola]